MVTTTIALTDRVYLAHCIEVTIAAFAHLSTATITPNNEGHLLAITAAPDVIHEFLNYALALSVQERLQG